jgi:hypothetical protein
MRCDAVVVSAKYASRQTHTWTLAGGKPTLRGAFEVRDGTWSVTGSGWLDLNGGQTWAINAPVVPAPINTLIRASDGRRLIQAGHAQLRADNALIVDAPSTLATPTAAPSAGGPRTGATATRPAATNSLTVFEWTFPPVEDSAKATTIRDSKQIAFSERLDRMQPAGVTGTATCAWHFSATDEVPPPPAPPALPPAPFLTATAATQAGTGSNAASRSAVLSNDQARAIKSAANSPPAPPAPVASVIPTRAQDAGNADAISASSGGTLSLVKPTGPAPADFAVTLPGPVTALVKWKRLQDADTRPTEDIDSTNWHLYRAEGSGTPVELRLDRENTLSYSNGVTYQTYRQPNEYLDAGIDPRIRYSYRLRAEYQDGTWGEAAATIHVLPPVNPTGFRATVVPPDTVKLEWDAMPGAIRYRLDGTTFPNTGHDLTTTSFTISPVRGPGSWQIAAIYAGNAADYANRPVARTLEKDIPAHVPAYLSKGAGVGSEAETAAHYAQFCNRTEDSEPCDGSLRQYLSSWGVDVTALTVQSADSLVRYNNVTDLGIPRETRCVFGKPTPGGSGGNRARFLQGSVICYSDSGKTVSMIVMNGEGALFGVFEIADADPSGYGGGWFEATLTPTVLFDSDGPKHAPQACLACHGGHYDAATKLVQDASLLPIDPSLVQLVAGDAAAQEKIRVINALVRQAYSSPAIGAYIDGLYGGMDGSRHKVDAAGTQAIADFVPSGWASQRNLYLDFVKKDCAMCHLAGPENLNFLSAGGFLGNKDLVHTAVCKAHSMPHAETAFVNFWTRQSGVVSGPGWFAAALGFQSCN